MKIVKTWRRLLLILTIGSTELTAFITAVSDGVAKSQKQGVLELVTPIEFEISVTIKNQGKGGLNIIIVEAGGKYEKESISKIKFSMGDPKSVEQMDKIVRILQTYSKTQIEELESSLKLRSKSQ